MTNIYKELPNNTRSIGNGRFQFEEYKGNDLITVTLQKCRDKKTNKIIYVSDVMLFFTGNNNNFNFEPVYN